jgi:4-hydroxy-2-oxoheptanedioate aldolase
MVVPSLMKNTGISNWFISGCRRVSAPRHKTGLRAARPVPTLRAFGETSMSELRAILRNHMKEKLARDEIVASMTVRFARSIEIAMIAKTAGFDTIYVDLEHNTLSIDTCCQICIAAQQIGLTPLVRVPANTPEYICRVLDGGAIGVITPHVRSADEARAMVEQVKFPPLGHRSAGGALSHYQYRSFPMAETNAAMNDATSLVVMLETVAALENVEAIIATEGVDMLLIGSNDLCAEMGITGQYDHPRLRDAFARAIEAARKVGKHVGVGGVASRDDLMTRFVRMGARFVSTGTDLSFLLGACAERARFARDIKI